MPGRDGTGPAGIGPATGRGLGDCAATPRTGGRMFCRGRQGTGRGAASMDTASLKRRKAALEDQMQWIDRQLEGTQEK